ncbi:MAG: hypothetical protein F3745_08065 [Nitrospinae bacterium]|nr:hypothetical protein [Nitrospinota bacterium]
MFIKIKKELLFGWVLLLGISSGSVSVWADIPEEQIKPAHVYVQAQRILNEVELIRLELGKAKPSQLGIQITNAQPREVYFQALTLYQKSDRLCFDHTGDIGSIPPKMKFEKTLPADVFRVLTQAMGRIRCVSDLWKIPASVSGPKLNPNHTPSDVFKKILEINRHLNFLLDTPYSPTTVFRQLQVTIGIIEYLVYRQNPDAKLPNQPLFVRQKRPQDVYYQMKRCLNVIQRIFHLRGNSFLDLKINKVVSYIAPGDVYDLVSLLLSETHHLGLAVDPEGYAQAPKKVSVPDRKIPSQVFQKAVYLERLLIQWESLIKNDLK